MRNFVGIFVIGLMGIAVAQENAENVAADDISTVLHVRNRRAGWTADKPGCTEVKARQDYEAVGRGLRSCLGQNAMTLPTTSASNDYVAQLTAQCERSDLFKNCLDNAASDKSCLYKQYNDIVRPRTKSYKAALDFFCDLKTGGQKCWNSKSEARERCVTTANSNARGSTADQKPLDCRAHELFQSCMSNELKNCDNSRVADVFNELWDATQMATTCGASAIANILFVTVTTALFSMRLL